MFFFYKSKLIDKEEYNKEWCEDRCYRLDWWIVFSQMYY